MNTQLPPVLSLSHMCTVLAAVCQADCQMAVIGIVHMPPPSPLSSPHSHAHVASSKRVVLVMSQHYTRGLLT